MGAAHAHIPHLATVRVGLNSTRTLQPGDNGSCVVRGANARDLAVNLEVPQQGCTRPRNGVARDLRVRHGNAAVLRQVLAAVHAVPVTQKQRLSLLGRSIMCI